MQEPQEPLKGWFWDEIKLELTQDVIWDSGKRGVNWKSLDGVLTIVDGVWTIKGGYKWDGMTGAADGPFIDPPQADIPVLSSKILVPITWLASLIHDVGYEYLDSKGFPYTRLEIDNFLRKLLREIHFYPQLYWRGVRILGGIWHWVRGIFVKRPKEYRDCCKK